MKFAEPQYFHFLWVAAAAALFLVWAHRRRKRDLERLADRRLLPELLACVNRRAPRWQGGLCVAVLVLSVLALARPQWGFRWEETRRRGNDIFIAIDTSKSMLAEDVKPNRLDRAKREVRDLLPRLKGDRVGLIPFAGTAFVQCPLTLDAAALRLFLEDLSVETLPQGGTAIGQAIDKALASFPGKERKHCMLVLVTDAEDLEGGAAAAAGRARAQGVALYAVGVGTAEGAPIPVVDESGAKTFLKDRQGQTVLTRLDLATLANLGVSGVASSMTEIYERFIEPMEKKELETVRQKRYDEKFQWPLFLALAVLLWEFIFPTGMGVGGLPSLRGTRSAAVAAAARVSAPTVLQKTKADKLLLFFVARFGASDTPPREGSPPTPIPVGIYTLITIIAMLVPGMAAAATAGKRAVKPHNAGVEAYREGKFDEARQRFAESLTELEPEEKEAAQHIHYNMGNAAYRLGRLPEALRHYERAVELDPGDEDARHNYEFVKKKLEQQQQQQQQEKQQQQPSSQENREERDRQEPPQPQEQKVPPTKSEQKESGAGEGEKEGEERPPREMTREEAQMLLNAVAEEELSAQELKRREKRGKAVEPEKDW